MNSSLEGRDGSTFLWFAQELLTCPTVAGCFCCPSPALTDWTGCQTMWKWAQQRCRSVSVLFKTAHHGGRGSHPAVREHRPSRALIPHFPSHLWECRCRWCCRDPAARPAELRRTASRLTGIEPAAYPPRRGWRAAGLGCCCPGGRCSPSACCSCCSADPWWRCPSEPCPSATLPPFGTPVRSGPARRWVRLHVRLLTAVLPPSGRHQPGAAALCAGWCGSFRGERKRFVISIFPIWRRKWRRIKARHRESSWESSGPGVAPLGGWCHPQGCCCCCCWEDQ